MSNSLIWSSIIKKLIMGLTGIFLCLFLAIHLLGNLQLFNNNAESFNAYAHFYHRLGILLYVIEALLVVTFIVHCIFAVLVYWQNKKARPISYHLSKKGGPPSRKTLASGSMIFTGAVVLIFIVWHLISFRFGPGIEEGYVAYVNGEAVIDFHRIVVEFFSNGWNVIAYMLIMILLGLHLSHGAWSTLQSLGLEHPKWSFIIYVAGIIFAILVAIGFLAIPPYLYFKGGV